jgi:hypothetical protein
MKPLNLDNSPCSPISSNCIVWQGPDIPCIHLCTGDTISDVVNKLATELCTVLDTLKVSNYDLSCFNLQACDPDDFQALIQFLITKICENEGITPATNQTSGCPNCVVSVAECFVTGTQRTMELVNYVQLIGERICNLITEVSLINDQLVDIITRVTILENTKAPSLSMPSFTIGCQVGSLLSGSSNQIDILLEEFINNVWCGYVAATGNASQLTTAVGRACITDASISLVYGNAMSIGYAGQWVDDASYSSVANAINNLWISLCDIYTYVSTDLPTTIVTQGDGITVTTSIVGSATTYEVSANVKPGLSAYIGPPSDLVKIAPGLSTGRLCDAPTQVLNLVEYNDFGVAYDITTGIFTVPATGRYTISFFSHFTRDVDNGWYDAAVLGMWTAGIVSPTGCNFYCVNNDSVIQTQKHASINGSITKELTIGTQICVKVLNLTNFDYISVVGDVVRFGVQRID